MVPVFGFLFLLAGMLLASLYHPWFGILTILGGLLMGFGTNMGEQKSKVLYYGSFLFLFVLFTTTYLIGINIIID